MQSVATRLEHTNALLDKYVKILSRSEKITKLILDERWEGADAVSPSPLSSAFMMTTSNSHRTTSN